MPSVALSILALVVAVQPGPRRSAAPADTLRYELSLATADSGRRVLDIRFGFRGSRSGRTRILLPHGWAGHLDLERQVVLVEGAAPGVRVEPGDSAHTRWVTHRPGAQVAVRYRIAQDWTGSLRRPFYHRVVLGPDLALLTGQNALVHPNLPSAAPVVLDVAWSNVPDGWRVASSYGIGPRLRARTTMKDLIEGVYVAGDLRSTDATVGERTATVMVHGTLAIPDVAIADDARELLARQRAFWREHDFPHFLLLVVPTRGGGGIGGTSFTDAVVIYADSASQRVPFARLLSHELFHSWNGHRMRSGGPEGPSKWFSEGLTEYYADRFAREAGFLDDRDYVDAVNASIRQYYTSPVRGTPAAALAATYWSDPNMNRLPYMQGYVLAGWLNARLMAATKGRIGLDSVMRTAYAHARRTRVEMTDSIFVAAAPAPVRRLLRAQLDEHVVRGVTVPVDATGFVSCATAEMRPIYPFDLGFDSHLLSREQRTITGVRPGSASHAAGLRDSMVARGWSWVNGNPERTVEITVAEGDSLRKITFKPRGATPVEVPQVVLGC